jgi:hypothetical protein
MRMKGMKQIVQAVDPSRLMENTIRSIAIYHRILIEQRKSSSFTTRVNICDDSAVAVLSHKLLDSIGNQLECFMSVGSCNRCITIKQQINPGISFNLRLRSTLHSLHQASHHSLIKARVACCPTFIISFPFTVNSKGYDSAVAASHTCRKVVPA